MIVLIALSLRPTGHQHARPRRPQFDAVRSATLTPDPEDTSSFLAAAVEASPGAIVAVDLEGRIVNWNTAAEKLLGFSTDDVVGQTLMSLVPEDAREAAETILARVRVGETIEGQEVARLRRDGSSFIVSLTVVPIRAADGTICGTVGLMNDITERKAFEELLRRQERLASIGTLAGGIAHEINNPVGGILMAAQFAGGALGREDGDSIVRKALADIEEDAKRCREIVRGLLRLAREEKAERHECDVNEVIEAAVTQARKNAADRDVAWRFDPGEGFPPLSANRTEVEQALVNLLNNAVEAGSRNITIAASVNDDDRRLRISVRDDGHGIPDGLVENLFDPFFTTRRQSGGTGLGLSLAHAIITNHHGTLDVTSYPPEGTTVTVELPLNVSPSE